MSPFDRLLIVLAAGCVLAGLCGCLVSSSSRVQHTGRYIGPATVAQIEPGKTRRDFVLATLGEPTSKTGLDDGSEVWKYAYRRRESRAGVVFLLMNSSSQRESEGATYIHLVDGVVERIWQD